MTNSRNPKPVPAADMVDRLAVICARLDGAREHEAWTGTSWRIGSDTFAHLVQIDDGWPPAYAKAFETEGPATVLTFQADGDERIALGQLGPPFHLPPWRPGIVGVVLDAHTDWTEIVEFVTESHRLCVDSGRRG